MDSFGQVGVDPGSQWVGGGQDDTLRRIASVCGGDTNPDDAFDASVEWDSFAQDTVDGLGSHTADCGGTGGTALTIDCGAALVVDQGVAGSATVMASDPDDTVVAMSLVSDDVTPAGSTVGTAAASPGDPATLELDSRRLADVGVYSGDHPGRELDG